MNDFTKEELLDLYTAIRHCYKQHIDLPSDTDTERFSYDLMEKINLMIDNYCEHDPLKKQITKAIDSCKAYGTKESEMLIFAYQNVLRWMAQPKVYERKIKINGL